ncbi:unnamed protein product, partial [Pleuronectes platessa]
SEGQLHDRIGKTPVTTFTMDGLNEDFLYVMAYYYALHMTYPKCISTLLSVLQTEEIRHPTQDLTLNQGATFENDNQSKDKVKTMQKWPRNNSVNVPERPN